MFDYLRYLAWESSCVPAQVVWLGLSERLRQKYMYLIFSPPRWRRVRAR